MDELIARHQTELYTLCRRLARNRTDADDLFQETWIKAWRNFHRYDPRQRFLPWLVTICLNLHRDRGRRHKRWLARFVERFTPERPGPDLEQVGSGAPAADETMVQREELKMLSDCLDTLADPLRIPLVLHYYFDWSTEEIAAVLEIPPGTVKSRMWTGRRQLAGALKEKGHD